MLQITKTKIKKLLISNYVLISFVNEVFVIIVCLTLLWHLIDNIYIEIISLDLYSMVYHEKLNCFQMTFTFMSQLD